MAERIGFIGLGGIGCPMAGSLVRAGYQVIGFDLASASLTSALIRQLREQGSQQ